MESVVYYLSCAMCLGGALGVIVSSRCVNAAMSMLLSMLGAAGLLLLMGAYFPAFVLVMVYAGAVLVMIVFAIMLVGGGSDGVSKKKKAALLFVWAAIGAGVGIFLPDFIGACPPREAPGAVLEISKNYGIAVFTKYALAFEVAGVMLLAAAVGAMAIAKPARANRAKGE